MKKINVMLTPLMLGALMLGGRTQRKAGRAWCKRKVCELRIRLILDFERENGDEKN